MPKHETDSIQGIPALFDAVAPQKTRVLAEQFAGALHNGSKYSLGEVEHGRKFQLLLILPGPSCVAQSEREPRKRVRSTPKLLRESVSPLGT